MLFIVYDKNTYKIDRVISAVDIEDVEVGENEAIFEKNVSNYSQTDIRVYNEDGSVKSLQQQVDEGILVLEPDEKILEKEQLVIKLNPGYEDQKIELIERGLLELEPTQKIIEENGSKYITVKTLEEQFSEGLVSVEEMNENIVRRRSGRYSVELDGSRYEIMDSVLKRLADTGELKLTEEEKNAVNKLIEKRKIIKEELPKY